MPILMTFSAFTEVPTLELGVQAHDAVKNLALILAQYGLQLFRGIGELGKALGKGRCMFCMLTHCAGSIYIGRQWLMVAPRA